MGQGGGFGGVGFSRMQHQRMVRIAVVIAFCCMCALAIGVPLMSKPAAVVSVPVGPTPIPLTTVWMPMQRISAGTLLTPLMFKKETLSELSLSALGGRPVQAEMELAGRYARTLIMPGRPVMVDQLMDTPESLITRKIRPGYRAVTVELTRVSGIEGWGVPGTRVDVMWVSSADAKEQFVTTIVRGAQILSVAGKTELQNANQVAPAVLAGRGASSLPSVGAMSPNQEKVFTVTLLVTPEDGQKIFLASRSGELSLMLHGDFDGPQDISGGAPFTTKRLSEGLSNSAQKSERVEGMAKARREDGSVEEWSVIEGRVWRWDQGPDAASGQQ